MGLIIFNGKSTKDMGIHVATQPNREFPERECSFQHVPGRNGDVVVDLGTYKNVERTYSLSSGSEDGDYNEQAKIFVDWLQNGNGYARLEDDYEPEYFRLGVFCSAGSITNIYHHAASINVKFNCMPQRFLKVGEHMRRYTTGGTEYIDNPTRYSAKPIIRFNALSNGSFSIAGTDITIVNFHDEETIEYQLNATTKYALHEDKTTEFWISTGGVPAKEDEKFKVRAIYRGSLEKIDLFRVGKTFTQGTFVLHDHVMYRALRTVTPSAWVPSDWAVADPSDPGYPTFGTTMVYADLTLKIGETDGDVVLRHTKVIPDLYAPCTLVSADVVVGPSERTYPGFGDTMIVLDCSTGEYYGVQGDRKIDVSQQVQIENSLPELKQGRNEIVFDPDEISYIEIVPKWWTV